MSGTLFDVAPDEHRSATLSPCRRYRYDLTRTWPLAVAMAGDWVRCVNFLMLNPSKADEVEDDNTIKRCLRFARDWGYSGIVVTNLFAWRATEPAELLKAGDPIGPANNDAILTWAGSAGLVVCAWGNDGVLLDRAAEVLALIRSAGAVPHALKLTGKGRPSHPLYLRADLVPFPMEVG